MEKPSPECRVNDLECFAVPNTREMVGAAYPSNCCPPENLVGTTTEYYNSALESVNCSIPGNQLGATAAYYSTLGSVNCSPSGRLPEVAATTSNNICRMGPLTEVDNYSYVTTQQLQAEIENCGMCTLGFNPEGDIQLVHPDGEPRRSPLV